MRRWPILGVIPAALVWLALPSVPARGNGGAQDGQVVVRFGPGRPKRRPPEPAGVIIGGRVVRAGGQPARDAFVTVTPVGSDPRLPLALAPVNPDGTFQLKVLDDRLHTLVAASRTDGFAVRMEVAPGVRDLRVELEPGGKARVEVVDSDGAPVQGAGLILTGINGERVDDPLVPSAETDARGVVERGLPAGDLEVTAFH